MDDLRRLKELEHLGISGVIVGQALYTGNIRLEEAIEEIEG